MDGVCDGWHSAVDVAPLDIALQWMLLCSRFHSAVNVALDFHRLRMPTNMIAECYLSFK